MKKTRSTTHTTTTSDLFHPHGDRARFHPPPLPEFGPVQKISLPGDLPIIIKIHYRSSNVVLRLLPLSTPKSHSVHGAAVPFCRTFSLLLRVPCDGRRPQQHFESAHVRVWVKVEASSQPSSSSRMAITILPNVHWRCKMHNACVART